MQFLRSAIIVAIGNVSLLNAIPTTLLIKNETNQSVVFEINSEYSLMQGISGISTASSSLSRDIESKTEINIIDWIIPPELRAGHTLSIKKLSVNVNNLPVNLGDYSAVRIVIFQGGNTISTRVEQLSTLVASRLAAAYWWAGVKASWSPWWKNFVNRRK